MNEWVISHDQKTKDAVTSMRSMEVKVGVVLVPERWCQPTHLLYVSTLRLIFEKHAVLLGRWRLARLRFYLCFIPLVFCWCLFAESMPSLACFGLKKLNSEEQKLVNSAYHRLAPFLWSSTLRSREFFRGRAKHMFSQRRSERPCGALHMSTAQMKMAAAADAFQIHSELRLQLVLAF